MFRGAPDPNKPATTEWEDIQAKIGANKEVTQEAIENLVIAAAEEKMVEDPLARKTLDELDELEDDEDEDILESYRKARLAEMQANAAKAKYGVLRQISGNDFVEQVTKANSDSWVVLLLVKAGVPGCDIISARLAPLAAKFRATKFLKAQSSECIADYPDELVPTILVYHGGVVRKTFATFEALGGETVTSADLEWKLKNVGAVESDLLEDPAYDKALKKGKISIVRGMTKRREMADSDEDSDEDWD